MRYPFSAAANEFLAAYNGVYSRGMADELRRRYPKIGRQLEILKTAGKISTTNPKNMTPDDVKEYVKYQRQRGLKPASISHDVSSIAVLCSYCGNQCVDVARTRYPLLFPKRQIRRLPVLERPDFDRILSRAAELTENTDPARIRCYAEVLFAIGTGPRTQELQHAKLRYLDADLDSIFFDHVKGQGTYGQTRTVPIRPEVRPILRLWLRVRCKICSSSEYLFPSKDGRYLSTNSLTKDRRVVCDDTGIDFDFRMCRRTYGQYLVDEGLPIDRLSVILGHSTSRTTETNYARPRDDRVVHDVIDSWKTTNGSENDENSI